MTSTILLLIIFFALFSLSVLLHAIFLRWGLRWADVARISLSTAAALAAVLILATAIIAAASLAVTPTTPQQHIALDLAVLALQVVVSCLILARLYHVRFPRALKAWLPTLIPALAMVAFLFLVFRPFVYEAFLVPTNGMAPTILGRHSVGLCPRCGHPAYGAEIADRLPSELRSVIGSTSRPQLPADGLLMICSNDRQTCRVTDVTKRTGPPDRILVSKFMSPRRWDVVVFRWPPDPTVLYTKRLVGMPGEELLLRDGKIWIDGKELELPDSLLGIQYLSSIDFNGETKPGAGSTPVKLASDEYFMLGDFSEQSSDSRFWEVGAPGHPRYAVPQSHMVGVVTHIYWPISRWRALR